MRVLAVNFFPAFHPPSSGGEQRYYYLYRYLSQWHDVTLLSPTYSGHDAETVTISPSFREHRVPKDALFDRLHWRLGAAGIGPECSGYVVALAAGGDTAFGRKFATLVREADIVIHDSPFTLPYDRTIDRDGKPRIYNAYNVEHRLAKQFFEGHAGNKAVEFIRFLEQELTRRSSLVLVTSREEGDQFRADFNVDGAKIVLAPNGFEPAREVLTPCSSLKRGAYALFMGSAHPPNVEAARHVVEHLAAAMPDTEFRLIGSVCAHLPAPLPDNVHALGFVDEAVKRDLLRTCGAAINPLFSGAGTNLKMLDYMAAGAPIVTTPLGARGLDLANGVDAFIADGDEFASVLQAVLRDKGEASQVGAAARTKAFDEYAWERIAGRVNGALEAMAGSLSEERPGISRRPFLLVVNDFSVLNPTGGGQVRVHELLIELGRTYDVALLCLSREPDRYERAISARVVEIGIPKTAEHRDAEVAAARGETVSIDDVLAADFVLSNVEFVSSFRHLVRRSAAVVFEHPFLAPLAESVPDDLPVVYSSLNVESDLKAMLLASRRDSARRIKRVAELEQTLLERSDLVVCVSGQDRARFLRDYPGKSFIVVENGTRVARRAEGREDRRFGGERSHHGDRPLAIFVGSSHMPNVHGARFLVESIAPRVTDVVFGFVGSVCDALRPIRLPPNVALFGILSAPEKDALLGRATIALNPLFDGGGSSLKVPDYLGAGLALLSTAVGVRGYDLQDGIHYLRAERDDFAEKVRLLATDFALRRRLATHAQAFAESQLDWHVLGRKYRDALRPITGLAQPTRVLVVTYRFADPAPGGAEAYLANILREMGARGNVVIDVVAPDVETISNKWHFSAKYEPTGAPRPTPDYLESLRRFPLDAAPPETFAHCARLFALWMSEMREQARAFRDHCDRPMLLGGWNFEETRGTDIVRWSSRHSEIHVGKQRSACAWRASRRARPRSRSIADRNTLNAGVCRGVSAWTSPWMALTISLRSRSPTCSRRLPIRASSACWSAQSSFNTGRRLPRVARRRRRVASAS